MMDFYGPIELETEDSEEFLDGFFGIFLHFWGDFSAFLGSFGILRVPIVSRWISMG